MTHDDITSDWRSGGDALRRLRGLLRDDEQTPLLLDRIADLLRTEHLARDAADRAVAKVLGQEWRPRTVPPLLRLVDGGRPTERLGVPLHATAADPEGVAGWYPNLPGWEDADVAGRARLLADVAPDLALWDGRAWTGTRLSDAIVEVDGQGFAAAMIRPRRLAARQQVLLLRFLAAAGPDATPADLAAAALLRERIEAPRGSWALHRSIVPAGVGAPVVPGLRSRAVDVLRRQPAGWYEVPGSVDPVLLDPERVLGLIGDSDEARAARDAAVADADVCRVREWDGTAWCGPAVPGERTALPAPHVWTGWSVRPVAVAAGGAAAHSAPAASPSGAVDAPASASPWLPSLPWRLVGGEGAASSTSVRLRKDELIRIVRTPGQGGEATRLGVHRRGSTIELRRDGTAVAVLAEALEGGPEAEVASAAVWLPALAAAGALDVPARTVVAIDVARHLLTGAVIEAVRLPGPEPLLEDLAWWQAEGDEDLCFELFEADQYGGSLRDALASSALVSDRALVVDGARVVWVDEPGHGSGDDPAVVAARAVPVRLDPAVEGVRTVGDRLLAVYRIEPVGWFDGASGHLADSSPSVLCTVRDWRGEFPNEISAWRVDADRIVEVAGWWLVNEIAEQLDEFRGTEHLLRLLVDGTIGPRFTLLQGDPEDAGAGERAEYRVEVALIGAVPPAEDAFGSEGGKRERRSRTRRARDPWEDEEESEEAGAGRASAAGDGDTVPWSVVAAGIEIRLEG